MLNNGTSRKKKPILAVIQVPGKSRVAEQNDLPEADIWKNFEIRRSPHRREVAASLPEKQVNKSINLLQTAAVMQKNITLYVS